MTYEHLRESERRLLTTDHRTPEFQAAFDAVMADDDSSIARGWSKKYGTYARPNLETKIAAFRWFGICSGFSARIYDEIPVLYDVTRDIYHAAPWSLVGPDVNNPLQWAFFSSEDDFARGRRTSTRPGRLLRRFAHHIREHRYISFENVDAFIAEVSNQWALHHTPAECGLATDASDIESIYKNGPRSCMAGDGWDVHPARVYGGPDTGVLYAKRGGKFIARAVVNRRDKLYGRIYGNDTALYGWLDTNGYTEDCDPLNGCRLLYIETNYGAIVCPYLDGDSDSVSVIHASDGNRYLMVDSDGEYHAKNEDGTIEDNRCLCSECGHRLHEDDVSYIESVDDYVCGTCLNHEFTWAVVGGGAGHEYVRNADVIGDYRGEWYTEEGAAAHNLVLIYDERPQSWHVINELVPMDEACICTHDQEWYHIDDVFTCAYDEESYNLEYQVTASDGATVFRDNLDNYESGLAEAA